MRPIVMSKNLQRRQEETRVRSYESSGGDVLSMEELFAADSGDFYDKDHPRNRFLKADVENFLEIEAHKKNGPAVECMQDTMDLLKDRGLNGHIWSAENMYYIASNENLSLEFMNTISAGLFGSEGSEHMRQAFENVLFNSMDNISGDPNGMQTIFKKAKVPVQIFNYGTEGIGVTATYQNEDHFSGLLGFAIANYFSRAKSLELYYVVKNNEKPELTYRYILEYAIDHRTMEKLALPDAERNGKLDKLFDLIDAVPTYTNDQATPHIFPRDQIPVDGGEDGWVKTGITGNLLSDTIGINKDENALEPNTRIDALLYITDYTNDDPTKPVYAILPRQVHTSVSEGLSEERVFGEVITIPNAAIIDSKGVIKKGVTVKEYISGYVNVDEGDYLVVAANPNPGLNSCIVGVKFYAKISDTANLRPGLQTTLQRYVYTIRTEYTNCGTIPINYYIRDNWNLGNDSIGWAASMTDAMSKRFAVTRDLKGERIIAESRQRPGNTFRLYKKMGAFTAEVEHDMSEAGASGSGDLMNTAKRILKEKIIFNLIDCETDMNFSRDMERLWVLMGHEHKIYAFEELNLTADASQNADIEKTVSNLKYGFDVERSAGYSDNFGRRISIIGAKDKRFVNRDVIGILRSNTLAAPTTIYMPFMFRVFTGIDARFTNLPSIQLYGRDLYEIMSKAQLNLSLLNLNSDTQSALMRSSKERYSQNYTGNFPVPAPKA